MEIALRSDGRAPLVSVIIPAYNAVEHITESLDSVFAQSFTDYEVLVINDGSPDTPSLEKVLERYRQRIIYLQQDNGGPGAARNCGIAAARGELVAFLDADDIWQPEFLAEQVEMLMADPSLDLVYADALLLGEEQSNGQGSRDRPRTFMSVCPSDGEVTLESLLVGRCHVLTSTVVARRQPVVAAGMFSAATNRSEDFDLWLRMAKLGSRIAYQRHVLAQRRQVPGSLSSDSIKMADAACGVLEAFSRRDDLSPRERRVVQQTMDRFKANRELKLGKMLILRNDIAAADAAIRKSNEYFRSWKLSFALAALRVSPRLFSRAYRSWAGRTATPQGSEAANQL